VTYWQSSKARIIISFRSLSGCHNFTKKSYLTDIGSTSQSNRIEYRGSDEPIDHGGSDGTGEE